MHQNITHYGLRVMADYSSVVFAAGEVRFIGAGSWDGRRLVLWGEGEVEVKGAVHVEVTGHGTLRVVTIGNVFSTIVEMVGYDSSLSFVYSGKVEGVVRIVNDVRLERGATYRERIAAEVSGLFDVATTVTHAARTTSDLVTKVAVLEGGKAIARGKIVIGKGAEGSKGAERIDALLLDPRAEADVLPTLAVDTDDATCKHAASVGHVDENALFYFESRGVDPAAARSVMTKAFLYA